MDTLRQIIHEFLSLVEDGGNSVEENERRLPELCDRLALASHLQRAQAEAGEFGDIPERDWQRTRRLVEQRFPRYGHYNAIRPVSIEVGSAEQSVGDAIDDLTDIIDQLAAVEGASAIPAKLTRSTISLMVSTTTGASTSGRYSSIFTARRGSRRRPNSRLQATCG